MDELEPCIVCNEDLGYLETESGWCVYIQCANCGSRTVHRPFRNDDEKKLAVKDVTMLWNMGKVIAEGSGV